MWQDAFEHLCSCFALVLSSAGQYLAKKGLDSYIKRNDVARLMFRIGASGAVAALRGWVFVHVQAWGFIRFDMLDVYSLCRFESHSSRSTWLTRGLPGWQAWLREMGFALPLCAAKQIGNQLRSQPDPSRQWARPWVSCEALIALLARWTWATVGCKGGLRLQAQRAQALEVLSALVSAACGSDFVLMLFLDDNWQDLCQTV